MAGEFQDPSVAVQGDPAQVGSSDPNANDLPNGETTSAQEDGQTSSGDGELGPSNLPPELEDTRKQLLRDYHAKTQKLADDRLRFEREMEGLQNKSGMLEQLMQQEWFKRAMEAERARRSGAPQGLDMTDEQFETLKNDKTAFQKYIMAMAQQMVQGQVDPALGALGETRSRLEEIQTDREFEDVASRYKDFRTLNDEGALDPYLEEGYDYETAYQKFKWETEGSKIDEIASKRAQEMVNGSRDGAVGKVGTPKVNGELVLKAKNFDQAFDAVWDAMKRGQKNVRVERG